MLSKENKLREMDTLLSRCNAFPVADFVAECKFYVFALDYYYSSEELVDMLKFDPETEDAQSKYQHCGKVAVEFNKAIEDNKLDGIKIVQKEDSDRDYFELDSQQENQMAVAATAMTIGSMIASLIGTTLVQVCRDFDPTD